MRLLNLKFMSLVMLAIVAALSAAAFAESADTASAARPVHPGQTLKASATRYPGGLNGHKTASGERFHQSAHTAASNKLPLGTHVKVTNLDNGASTNVKVTDRGPGLGSRRIDLTKKAAKEIGLTPKKGIVPVQIKVTRTPDGREPPPSQASR